METVSRLYRGWHGVHEENRVVLTNLFLELVVVQSVSLLARYMAVPRASRGEDTPLPFLEAGRWNFGGI